MDDPEFPARNEIRIGAEVGRRKTDALPDRPPLSAGGEARGERGSGGVNRRGIAGAL